ncbi:hypothetical protein AVHY2522_18435 [Acidovorax sp. SUPP2522]|jgi:hypothetical protein|uniref:hypothetical protein n=1 Tax=unclassified Acidovorax TaxID=2684926 RepID=UPI00234B37CF|nr:MULTISPECIES: hypothetical protein [unclassified Acidovorax]WCM96375.1 hypothetical protein M5C96_18330 [Acidovorax sp. GBBC 1281]GKT18343.1 hypothetical protein AVHY2522_18435 [Acidovorax sp. SUPP2522]
MTKATDGSAIADESCIRPDALSDERGAAASGAGSPQASLDQVELNTALHLRLLRNGGVRASTYASAMQTLEELRRKRNR